MKLQRARHDIVTEHHHHHPADRVWAISEGESSQITSV